MTLTRRLCSLLAAVVVAALLPLTTPPAEALKGSRYLCTGYAGCKEDGYPHFGYKKAGKKMWWQMYPGHNCTNYVAYRLVRGGMPNDRPWSGEGNASHWGRAKRGITDGKPMVGSVAWWKANVAGAGSSGHVAYVERVISRRKVVISEDSWGGDFHWRVLTKSGSGWPSGFIHFDDRKVRARTRPAVSGTPAVGNVLTATSGRWVPAASYRFQWLAGKRAIPGATTQRLELTPQLLGERIAVRVHARQRGYLEGKATSERTPAVRKGTFRVTARPRLTGTPQVGHTLQLDRGSWSPSPDSVTVRWFAGGDPVAGAQGDQLRLDRSLIGKRIRVRTTARAAGYEASALTTDPTAEVRPGRVQVTEPFTLGGHPTYGGRLTVTPGRFTPSEAEVSYTWLRNGNPIDGAHGRHLELRADDVGKRVSVRAVLSHPGYNDRVITLAPEQRVTTIPKVRSEAAGKPGRAVVRVRVTAPGAPEPGGRLSITVGGRKIHGKVVDGRFKGVVRELERGRYKVRVRYYGTTIVLPGRVATTVRVPGRGD